MKHLVFCLASLKCKLFSRAQNKGFSRFYDRKFTQSYTTSKKIRAQEK